jgi:predicted acylesterase/phospholipase RssA
MKSGLYAGTSAGAITAALLGAGYTADELRSIMMETDFSAFLPELRGALPLTWWLSRLYA